MEHNSQGNEVKHNGIGIWKIASDFSPGGSKNQTAKLVVLFLLSEKPI